MARISFFITALLFATVAIAQEEVIQALVSSDQTYVVNDQGESVQEYGIGQLVYIVMDPKASKDKKRKDFYRVTFDPTNMKGDGWVQKDKVKLMTSYHSIDGKEPKEYENKPEPVITKKSGDGSNVASGGAPSSESTFLEELVKKDQEKPELKPVTDQPKGATAAAPKKEEKNALQNNLEFLFQQDGEFKKTYDQTKTAVKTSMQKKIAVSKFVSGADAFATSMMDELIAKLQSATKLPSIPKIAFAPDLEDASHLKPGSVPADLDGVFFGQMSPKIGDGRLLKIKYYDQKLKQFTFEKVVKIPLAQPGNIVEKLANDCNQFLSK